MWKCKRPCLVSPWVASQGTKHIWVGLFGEREDAKLFKTISIFQMQSWNVLWQCLYQRDLEQSRNGKAKEPTSVVSREAKFSRSISQVLSCDSWAVLGICVTTRVVQSHLHISFFCILLACSAAYKLLCILMFPNSELEGMPWKMLCEKEHVYLS